jgi:tetratricopeptide (TPR) repeat protein
MVGYFALHRSVDQEKGIGPSHPAWVSSPLRVDQPIVECKRRAATKLERRRIDQRHQRRVHRFWGHSARAYFAAKRYDEAIKAFQRVNQANYTHFAAVAAWHAALGDEAVARAAAHEVLKREPTFSVVAHLATRHYKHESDLEHYRGALLRAGLSP